MPIAELEPRLIQRGAHADNLLEKGSHRTSVSFVQVRLQLENDGMPECNISCGGREIREASGCCCRSRRARRNFLKGAKECRDENLASVLLRSSWGAPVFWRPQVRADLATGASGRSTIRKEEKSVSDMASRESAY